MSSEEYSGESQEDVSEQEDVQEDENSISDEEDVGFVIDDDVQETTKSSLSIIPVTYGQLARDIIAVVTSSSSDEEKKSHHYIQRIVSNLVHNTVDMDFVNVIHSEIYFMGGNAETIAKETANYFISPLNNAGSKLYLYLKEGGTKRDADDVRRFMRGITGKHSSESFGNDVFQLFRKKYSAEDLSDVIAKHYLVYGSNLYSEGSKVSVGSNPFFLLKDRKAKTRQQYFLEKQKKKREDNTIKPTNQNSGNKQDRQDAAQGFETSINYKLEKNKNEALAEIMESYNLKYVAPEELVPKKYKIAIKDFVLSYGEFEDFVVKRRTQPENVITIGLDENGDQAIVIESSKAGDLILEPLTSGSSRLYEFFANDTLPPPVPRGFLPIVKGKPRYSSVPSDLETSGLVVNEKVKFFLVQKVVGIVVSTTPTRITILKDGDNKTTNILLRNVVEKKKRVLTKKCNAQKGYIICGKVKIKLGESSKDYKAGVAYRVCVKRDGMIEGKIVKIDDAGFHITYKSNNLGGKTKTNTSTTIIPFTSQRPIPYKKTNYILFEKSSPDAIFNNPVTQSIRETGARSLFIALSHVIPNIYISTGTTSKALETLREKVNWNVINTAIPTFEEYEGIEFRVYLYSLVYQELLETAPDFSVEASKTSNLMKNPSWVITNIIRRHGVFLFAGDGLDVLRLMKESHAKNTWSESTDDTRNVGSTNLEVYIIHELSKIGDAKLRNLTGSDLAAWVSNIIATYMKIYPSPPVREIESIMQRQWVSKEFKNYKGTKKQRHAFRKAYHKDLLKQYTMMTDKYNVEYEKLQEYEKMKNKLQNKLQNRPNDIPANLHPTVNGLNITNKGLKLAAEVSILEEKIYENSVKPSVLSIDYIKRISELCMFLDPQDSVGEHAKTIQSLVTLKSKNVDGAVNVKDLWLKTYQDLYPELFKNKEILLPKTYETATRLLAEEIKLRMLTFVDILTGTHGIHHSDVMWSKFTFNTCPNAMRLKSGQEYKGLDTIENYDCTEIGDDKYSCKAKLERLPESDSIIYHDSKTNSFSCVSLSDVLNAIKGESKGITPVDPVSGNNYDSDFLARMKTRYAAELSSPDLVYVPHVISFEATEYETLFGRHNEDEDDKEIDETNVKHKKKISQKTKKKATKRKSSRK